MNKNKYQNKKQYKKERAISPWFLSPIIFIIAFVPLIVFGKVVHIDGLEALYWKGGESYLEFFHYYKSMFFLAGIGFALFLFILLILFKQIKVIKTHFYIPMAIYVLFVLISFFVADDRDVALRGHADMFQGIFVLLGYILLVILIFHMVQSSKHIRLFVVGFIFVGTIVGIIGLLQYFGYDIFKTDFGKQLILPSNLHYLSDSIIISSDMYRVYATLYNTNFVGSFAALMIPLSFGLYFYQKKVIYAILSMFFVTLMVFIGFGSNSRAGIIGVIAAIVIMVIVFRKSFIKKPFYVIIPFIMIVLVGFILNQVSDGRIINEIKHLSITNDIRQAREYHDSRVNIEFIEFNHHQGIIKTDSQSLKFQLVANDLEFTDLEGNPLETYKDDKTIHFVDEPYKDFSFTRSDDQKYYIVQLYENNFDMWITIDGFKFNGLSGNLYTPINPEKIEFLDRYGRMFSSRAFIWSRSIPMLKDYILVGAGPDMFTIAYPQNDLAGKLNYMGIRTVVSKPHNMYLQTGINTGIISLLALIAIFLIYLYDCFKLYFKREFYSFREYIGAGLFASVIAYLVSGFFNDQIISVAPIFYAMLGLGIAINFMIKKSDNMTKKTNK